LLSFKEVFVLKKNSAAEMIVFTKKIQTTTKKRGEEYMKKSKLFDQM
jgi:hypothetical protein